MIAIEARPVHNCTVKVPGSKSYTHRLLIAAALSSGNCTLRNALRSEDTDFTLGALRQMGIEIDASGTTVEMRGGGGRLRPTADPINLGNSGTSMRLLMSTACLGEGDYLLTGTPRMQERPVQPLVNALVQMGVRAECINGTGCPPVRIHGGDTRGGDVAIDCSVSSQFLSSLLLAAPCLQNGMDIRVVGAAVSRPYIDMTVDILDRFGVQVEREGYERFRVTGGQPLRPGRYSVEPDASNASYFWAVGAISGRCVTVEGIRKTSLQGDLGIVDLFEKMGCRVTRNDDGWGVQGGELRGIEADMGNMPDMVPTLGVVAAFARGTTVIRNVAHLKAKECNRLAAVMTELGRMGIETRSDGNDLIIVGGKPRGAEIETYDDHRIAMSFAVAGLMAEGTRIRNEHCVDKSFPGFWQVFAQVTT
ncbi:MAG: 3-phosphoshikimate 1-carboxyvinyltransferase [Desulfobacterales bacterium]|nr:3-phosphoshikimate 1-carboxyvinyltransferase [Desulfobacterales bacterium]